VAIMKCIKEPAFAAKIAANGKNRAFNMFSVERFVSDYEAIFKDVMLGRI